MTTLLAVYDERPGAGKALNCRLELPSERITARDLIRRRIEAELSKHNSTEQARFADEVTEYGLARAKPNDWLVRPGETERALNGERGDYGPRPGATSPTPVSLADVDRYVATAFAAFERNGFFMIFDGRQVTDLDEMLTVEKESALTFIRLVPLVGG